MNDSAMCLIKICKAVELKHIQYIENCVQNNDFDLYIGKHFNNYYEDAYLFFYNEKIIGVFWPQISEKTGVKIAMPNIYMTQRKSKFTLYCLARMISELFLIFQVEKLFIVVYGNNKTFIKMIENYDIYLEGIFSKGIIIQNEVFDVYYFSILRSELIKLDDKYKDFYG